MKFTEKIQGLISRGEIQDASTNMLEDTIGAVLGDPISVGKIMLAIVKSPFFIREQLFWTKMEAFLNGVYLNENDCAKLRATLTSDGEKQDNALRLVESIDRAETQQKIRYLIFFLETITLNSINLLKTKPASHNRKAGGATKLLQVSRCYSIYYQHPAQSGDTIL